MRKDGFCFLLLLHLFFLAGCGGGQTADPVEDNQPAKADGGQVEQAASSKPIEEPETEPADDTVLMFVPADALLACVAYPRRVFSEDEVARPWERFLAKVRQDNGPLAVTWHLRLEALGIRPVDLEQVVYVAQDIRVREERVPGDEERAGETVGLDRWEIMTFGIFQDAFVLRFHDEVPWPALTGMVFRAEEVEYAGKTYYGTGQDVPTAACYRVDEHTVLFGEETVVRKMLVPSTEDHPLVDQIKTSGPQPDLVAVLNLAAASEDLIDGLASDPSVAPVVKNLSVAALTLDMGPRPAVSATIVARDADGGAQIDSVLRGLLSTAKQNLPPPEAVADPAMPDEAKVVFGMARNAVENVKIDYREDRVEISLGDVVDRGALFGLLDLIEVPLPEEGGPAERKPAEDENETATIIRQLAPSAAGMANADMSKLAMAATTPKATDVKDQTLTLVVLCEKILDLPEESYAERWDEFRFDLEFTPKPAALVRCLTPSTWLGYCSMLQPQYITKVTCDTDGESASGTISFDAGMYAGRVQYAASKTDAGWQIDEFSFPVRDWRFLRADDGTWEWFDHFGRFEEGRELPLQDVEGVVQLDGKPLDVTRLSFTLKNYPDFAFYAKEGEDGRFSVSLPPGQYRVVVRSGNPQLAEDYRQLSTTPLVVEIEDGQTELTLSIPKTQQSPESDN